MTVSIICFIIAILMLALISHSESDNPNGVSISIFQKIIGTLDLILSKYRIISSLFFVKSWEPTNPKNIERIVWKRLSLVSFFSLILEVLYTYDKLPLNKTVSIVICIYVFILQITLLNSLLKPLFGVKRIGEGLALDKSVSKSITFEIPTPKRSLLLALVNFFEIIISWGIIYRVIMPSVIKNLDNANYFSIVTITTVGYGDINGGSNYLTQTAVTFNLIVFVVFSVCHIATILGTITSNK